MMAVTYVIYGVASIGLWETLIEQIERDDVTPPPKKRKVIKVFNSNSQGSRLRRRPKNRWRNCVQIDIN